MAHKNQKLLFGFLVMVTLTLQGCGTPATTQTTTTTTTTTSDTMTNDTSATTDTATVDNSVVQDEVAPEGDGTANGATGTAGNTGAATSDQSALNGTFHLTATYNSPAGEEPLDATVTLQNNVITAVSAKNVAVAQMSKKYQDDFISGIAGQVVGKNIKDVNVTYVNGSSLTAAAFNKALHALENNN